MNEPPSTVFLRPLGSPVGLGLSGLVVASLVTSGLDLGWAASDERSLVAIALIAFAFPLQTIASVLAFIARDGAVGTAMGVLAGTWLATGLDYLATPPGSTSDTLGLLMLAVAGLLAAAASGAATGKRIPAAVFFLAAVRFLLIGLYELSGAEGWQNASGVVGLAVVVLAGYTMLAVELEASKSRTVLPMGRSGPIEHEPGVRPEL